MSFWVSLEDAQGETCTSEPFEDGGTFVVGGSDECSLNVTYNYSRFYYGALDESEGLRAMNGGVARDWHGRLEQAVSDLGTERDNDYWAATAGNAGATLARLLAWARAFPDATFRVN